MPVDRYPDGYDDGNIITFKIQMVKYDEDDYEDFEHDGPEAIPDFDIEENTED